MSRRITVALMAMSLSFACNGEAIAVNAVDYLNSDQITDAVSLNTIRLNKTIYGFFEDGRMLISTGTGLEKTKWLVQNNKLCFNKLSNGANSQLLCARIGLDNLTKKMFFVFDPAPDKRYEVVNKGNIFGYEKAVSEARVELLQDPSTTEEQRRAIQSEQARFDAGFADPVYSLGSAYKKYMSIKKCYEDRKSYQVVYVTDDEYLSSKKIIAAIEKYAQSVSPSISTDQVWKDVTDNPKKYVSFVELTTVPVNDDIVDDDFDGRRVTCQGLIDALAKAYKKINPEAFKIKKDF